MSTTTVKVTTAGSKYINHSLNASRIAPELLDWILELEGRTRPTMHACAFVNRHWSHRALAALWRDLPSIKPVLKLYGPLTYNSRGVLVSSNLLSLHRITDDE